MAMETAYPNEQLCSSWPTLKCRRVEVSCHRMEYYSGMKPNDLLKQCGHIFKISGCVEQGRLEQSTLCGSVSMPLQIVKTNRS